MLPVSSILDAEEKILENHLIKKGDTIIIFGENASPPKHLFPYFTMGCMHEFKTDTVSELIRSILELNPKPGEFSVKRHNVKTGGHSILEKLDISESQVTTERIRYAIHIKEEVKTSIHLPLYIFPLIGISLCGNTTDLEATIWELPSEKFVGKLNISAKGDFVGLAYIVHLYLYPDTQKDATQKLAKKIIETLTGLTINAENEKSDED